MKKYRGLNLGGWLVLEKWMTPELFVGYSAKDEYNLLLQLGDLRKDVISKHRETFITENDFKWMKDYGINVVRLPVGHWLFEDKYPYLNARHYVNKAFKWGNKYDIKILLDLHAAPGCQNGFDNGGLAGIVDWTKGDNIDLTLSFIEQLALEFKAEESLLGIEVLNEPRWDIDIKLVQKFYLDAYKIIRRHLDDEYVVVFHDAFRLNQWREFFEKNKFENVLLDTHMYQVFSDQDSIRNTVEVIEKVSFLRYKEIKEIDFVNLIVGEWSLGIHKNTIKQLNDEFEREVFYRAVGNSLLTTFENTKGWFFWNYKLSEESTNKYIGWSFVDIVNRDYLPKKIKGE